MYNQCLFQGRLSRNNDDRPRLSLVGPCCAERGKGRKGPDGRFRVIAEIDPELREMRKARFDLRLVILSLRQDGWMVRWDGG